MTSEKKAAAYGNCIERSSLRGQECILDGREKNLSKPSLLMHSCCGPCSTACIERMAPDYEITIFFYNPNITDKAEYDKRKENQIRFIKEYNKDPEKPGRIAFMEGDYDTDDYLERCGHYSDEPEGGKRCWLCFDMRLQKTAETAAMLNFDTFTTTLTVSPHKDKNAIFAIGRRHSDTYKVGFLEEDFKKKDGFKRSCELAKQYELYRQDFCGCEFSRAESMERMERKAAKETAESRQKEQG